MPNKTHQQYTDEYKRVYGDYYLALTKGDKTDDLYKKLEDITSQYVVAGGNPDTLIDAAVFSTRALKDDAADKLVNLITKNPVVNGVNKEALRVSGIGNRFGVQIILDSGTDRLAIGVGNNSMHAFTFEAGFNQVVDVKDAARIVELQGVVENIGKDVAELKVAIRGKGRLSPGANKYVTTTFDPMALRRTYKDKKTQWNQAMDELGKMASRYYTDVVLPGNNTEYSRVLPKIVKQNPKINLYVDSSVLPYAQRRDGEDLPVGQVIDSVSNITFFSDEPYKRGDYLIKRVKVADHSFAILAKHEPSGKVIAYIPPIRVPKQGEKSVLEKILQDPDFPIDLMYVDMRYSDINNMIMVDPEFTSTSYRYLTDREIANTIVRTYIVSDKRPENYVLMNIDNNTQAGTIAGTIEDSLLSGTESKVNVFLSPISHDQRGQIFVMDRGDTIAIKPSNQTRMEIIQDAIQLSQERSRDARASKAEFTIEDLNLNIDDENAVRGLTTADEDIRTEADEHLKVVLSDLEMPKSMTGEDVIPDLAPGVPNDAFGIIIDQTEVNKSAVGWVDLHVEKKAPSEIESLLTKFTTADGKKIQLLGIKNKPEYQKLLRNAVLSQDEFNKNIVWVGIRDSSGITLKSNIDARAEFTKLIRDYTWVNPNFDLYFDPDVDWIRHGDDVIEQITTESMFHNEKNADKIVEIYQGITAKFFGKFDERIIKELGISKNKHEIGSMLKERTNYISKIGKQVDKELSKNYVVLSGLASDYGMSIEELYKTANNFDQFSKLPVFDKLRELKLPGSAETIESIIQDRIKYAQRKILYHYNHNKAYADFIGWINKNNSELSSVVDLYLANAATIQDVETVAFTIHRASAFTLRGLSIELEARFDQLSKIVDVKKSFDSAVDYRIGINKIQELFKKIDQTTDVKARAFLIKELDNSIKRFGGVNNLFVDPPIYLGFDTAIGGHVSRILADIGRLHNPSIDLLQGPFENVSDFNKFQSDVRRIENGIREYADTIRGNNELETLVKKYFTFKVNNFAKNLDNLGALGKHAEYNAVLNEATEFVLGTLGYAPTELRRFVLLDLADINQFKRENFDSSAGVIFTHAEKLIKEATDKMVAKVKHVQVIENGIKVASNKELFSIMTKREILVNHLANIEEALSKLELQYSNLYYNLPKDKTRAFNIRTSSADKNATDSAFLSMNQLRNNRVLLVTEMVDIRAKIVELDLEKITKFDMVGEGLYADDVVGGFNAIRAGKINPEATNEIANILAIMDVKKSEKTRLMITLHKIQTLHADRLAMTDIASMQPINKEIFDLVAAEAVLSDPHKYAKTIYPKINSEMGTNWDVDRHIGFIIEAIEFRLAELDLITNRAEKAIQGLKSYGTRIDIPFKKFIRENVSDDTHIVKSLHYVLGLSGDKVATVKYFAPSLYTGATDRPGLPLDLMKKFGLSGNDAFLFPTRVAERLVYKLHIPINASPKQADSLIAEAERITKFAKFDTLVVEFSDKIFKGFVPDSTDYPMLSKYYTIQKDSKLPTFELLMPNKPTMLGSGYHYDIAPDNKIRRFQTIISKAPVSPSDPYIKTPLPPMLMDAKEHMEVYNRVRIIINDIGTETQKAMISGEMANWNINALEDMTELFAGGIRDEKGKVIKRAIDEGVHRYKGLETVEFPVVVYVDKNNNIRIKNLGFNRADGTPSLYSQIVLNSGRGYLPVDAEFSILVSGTEDKFRVTGAEGTLPKEVSFDSITHVITELVSTKTRMKYMVDIPGVERHIQTSLRDMNKEIKGIGLGYNDIKYVTDAEVELKKVLSNELQSAPGVRSVENAAMEKYQKGMSELHKELLSDKTKYSKWHKYVSIKNNYLGEIGKSTYGEPQTQDGVITAGSKLINSAGVHVWFDDSIPVRPIPTSYIDLQIKEVYVAIAANPQRSNELYEKLEALKAMRSQFVSSTSRTLVFNPSMNVIYNEYILRQLIDVNLQYATITKDKVMQAKTEQQIKLLHSSIKREEELLSKVRLYANNNKVLIYLSSSDGGGFLGSKELTILKAQTVLTDIEAERLRKLQAEFMYYITLTTNQSRLSSDIDKMVMARAESSSIGDWFRLRWHVTNVVAKDWLSNTATSLARILPKTADFWDNINGSSAQYVNLFAIRDEKIRELANATRKASELKARYNLLISSSGIGEQRAEYLRIKKDVEELFKRRTAILDKFAQIHTADNAADIIGRLNGGVPFFEPDVIVRMKYILLIEFERLKLEKIKEESKKEANAIRINSINNDILDIETALKNFDKVNEENMLRRSVFLGVDTIEKEIEISRNRLATIDSTLANINNLKEIQDLDVQIFKQREVVDTVGAELDSIKLNIKRMPAVIADDANYIYLMRTQRVDQIIRMERILASKKNDYDKAGGDIAIKLKEEIDELESEIVYIKEQLADEKVVVKVKEAETRLAKNMLQYDDVKLANLQYVKDQIVDQTKNLRDINGRVRPEVEARIKQLNDTLKRKDLYDQLRQTLNELGHVQSERMWVLENARKVDMFPKYTRRLVDLDEKLGILRSKLGELTGQMSTLDPFYDIQMLKHDMGVVKQIFKNLIKLVSPPPKDVITIAENNLAEIYVKRYVKTQFERRFNNAAESVDQLLDGITAGKSADPAVVSKIANELKIKSVDDLVFLNPKFEEQFRKTVAGKRGVIDQDISNAAGLRGKILTAETKINEIMEEINAAKRLGVFGRVLSAKDVQYDIRKFNLLAKIGIDPNKHAITTKDIELIQEYIDKLDENVSKMTDNLAIDRAALKKFGKIEPLDAERAIKIRKDFILKDLIDFIDIQKVKTPSTRPDELGKLFDYTNERVGGPLQELLDNWTAIYAKEFDVVSVDRLKLLTILSRNVDKNILDTNILKLERKAHDLRIKLNEAIIERDFAYKGLLREYESTAPNNLQIGRLKSRINSLYKKQVEFNADLLNAEELISVGKQFTVRGINIADIAAKVQFKESVLDFLQLSLGKQMATDEVGRLKEVDQIFDVLRIAKANRLAFTFNEIKDRTITVQRSELGNLINGVVDGVLHSTNNYNAKTSKMLSSELERHLRSLGVNVNSTFKVAGWNLPKVKKTLNKALIVDITSPVFIASVRESFKQVGIDADEFIYDMTQSLQSMSGVSKDHYGRYIVNALRTNIESNTMDFLTALSKGSVEMPLANLQYGLSQKEVEEYKNLSIRRAENTLDDMGSLRLEELRKWIKGYRVAPKFEEGQALKTYVRPYLLDDGRIVIAANEVVYDPNFDILEPRFRVLKVFNESPLTRVEKYLFENYSADRKMYNVLFTSPSYDSRGLVASALELILKEKFGIVVDKELLNNPDAIYIKYKSKLHSIDLIKLFDPRNADPSYMAKVDMKINPARWVSLMNETKAGVQDTFLNMLRASGVDVDILIRSDEWAKEYQPKITAYGKVHEEISRLERRINLYEADIYARVNDLKAPRGVQIGLNPKLIANFLLRGKLGQDMQDTASRYKKAMFPEGYDSNAFNIMARDIKTTIDKFVYRSDIEQLIDKNKNRKSTVESLLDRGNRNIKSIGIIDGTEYTTDDIEKIAAYLRDKTKKLVVRLQAVGIEDVGFGKTLFEDINKNPKGVIREVMGSLDIWVLNSVSNSIEPSYKKLGSTLDDVLSKIEDLERRLLNMPFIKAEYNKDTHVWHGHIKLANGNAVPFTGVDEELVSLRKFYSETTDGAEKILINADIRSLENLSSILSGLSKTNQQYAELDRILKTDAPEMNKYIRIFDTLYNINNDINTADKLEFKRLDRIKYIKDRITFLVGERPDELGGEINRLKSIQRHPSHMKDKIKELTEELNRLQIELNGGVVYKGIIYKDKKIPDMIGKEKIMPGLIHKAPSKIRIAEYVDGEIVLHTVNDLVDELRIIDSAIDNFTTQLPKMDELRIFQRMVRPVQVTELAIGDELIGNINTVMGELADSIVAKNDLIIIPRYKQDYVSGIIYASANDFSKEIKRLRVEIEEAKKLGDKHKYNDLLVRLNDLTERRKVIKRGEGKMFVDEQDILSDQSITREIHNVRAKMRVTYSKKEMEELKDQLAELNTKVRTPIIIRQVNETEAVNRVKELREIIDNAGVAAKEEDIGELQRILIELNEISEAGVHVKMNTEQIAILDRVGVLFDRGRTINNHEWMALYSDDLNKLMARLNEVGDPFLGAKYINSTYHNLGVMMQRDMNIEQILARWHEDTRGMLEDVDVRRTIDDLMGGLKPGDRERIYEQLDVLREKLAELPEKDETNLLLRGYYDKKISILEDRVGVTSQRGFRKYQAVFEELNIVLGGGVTNDGKVINGLVFDRQVLIDQINAAKADLDLKSLDAEGIKRYEERIWQLTKKRDEFSVKILGIENVINKVLNITTNEYQINLQRFKEIAMSLPLEPKELLYIERIDKKFPNEILLFVEKIDEQLSDMEILKPKLNELYVIANTNNRSARDTMHAIVEQMGMLSTHSIPTGEELAPDVTARFKINVDYFDRGELKFPTGGLPDFGTASAQLVAATKKYNTALDGLPSGTVVMSEQQIQTLRIYLDNIVIPTVSTEERNVWVSVMAKLKEKGYNPSTMLPSDLAVEKKRLLRSLQSDKIITKEVGQKFLKADKKITAYAGRDKYLGVHVSKLEKTIGDLAETIRTQTELANMRATMAKHHAEIMLIQNMVHYNDADRLKKELIKLINTRDFIFAYKDMLISTKIGVVDIKLPGKTQTISMNDGLVEKLANTFNNKIYLSRMAPNGEVVRDVKIAIKDAVTHTELTDERMRVLRKITSDISEKYVKATGEMLSFTDAQIKEAYKLMSMEGIDPLYKYFAIVDISKDGSGKYVPVIDGALNMEIPLDDVAKMYWRDPFAGYTSEASTEVQLLEEYLKVAFIRSDNMAIKDTFREIIKVTMPEKIDQILNVIRTRIPYESTLKYLDKTLTIGISKGIVVGQVVKEAVVRIERIQHAVNSFTRQLLNNIGIESEKLLFSHAGMATKYYKKGAKFVRYVGGRKDVGSLLRKIILNASIKNREELINTAALVLNEETRRTMAGLKNIISALTKGTYIMNARETTNTLNNISSVAKPIPWDMTGPASIAAWDWLEKETMNWSESVFDKRSNNIVNRLLGRVNMAGNNMDRKMSQGVMPQFAVGGAIKDVRGAYNQATNDLEGLISDTGYTAFNRTAMANFMDNTDQIRYFEYTAINDSRTCKYCRSTHGVLYKPTEPRPQLPRHPNCRCIYRPWFKSISNAADELESAPTVPRVPVGGTFVIGPDDFAGFGDGLSKLMRPINPDGTISDEDWIMWFNKQPANIRQMMVGDAHELANSIGVFGVDSPANKKALIAEASKNIAKQFAKDMGNNSIRALLYNTFTNKEIYLSLFKVANSPKSVVDIVSNLPWKTLMFGPGGVVKNSVTDAFNKSVNGFVPIDPNEAGPLQAILNRIAGNKTFGLINTGRQATEDFILAKMAGMTKEEFVSWKDVLSGKVSDKDVADGYTKAIGNRNKVVSENQGFLQGEFMRAFDPWFNIGSEGISPLADMSIVARTKIFTDLANDIKTLPEDEAISARLRAISRNNKYMNSIYDMGSMADDGIYRAQDLLNSELIDTSVDAVAHKDVLDIYGKLQGKTQSGATDLLNSAEFKSRLSELTISKRGLLIDMIKKPTVQAAVKRFFMDAEDSMATELDLVRIVEITPNGMRLFGSMPMKANVTIGPDGKFYATSKEELIQIWKKVHPRVDISKFVSMEIDIGGNMEVNPAYIDWMQTTGANMERIPYPTRENALDVYGKLKRQSILKTKPSQYIGHAEYVIKTNEGNNINKNKKIVEEALGSIHGISPWSTRDQIKELATAGLTRIGQGNPNVYGKKYAEAISKIEYAIKQVVSTMKNEVGMRNASGKVNEDKIEQIARTVRGYVKDILDPYAEYKDVHGPIMQFMGEDINSEIFLSRIRLIAN